MTSAGEPRDPPVLQMRGISKRYPGARALDNASLDVRAGEVLVLLGENGAGKSTLMKVLSGAVRADEGEILLDGSPVDLGSPLRARRLGIGTIPCVAATRLSDKASADTRSIRRARWRLPTVAARTCSASP